MGVRPPTFGRLIRDSRVLHGWTQEFLATKVDRSQTWISFVENGQLSPSLDERLRLMEALEIPDEVLDVLA